MSIGKETKPIMLQKDGTKTDNCEIMQHRMNGNNSNSEEILPQKKN